MEWQREGEGRKGEGGKGGREENEGAPIEMMPPNRNPKYATVPDSGKYWVNKRFV